MEIETKSEEFISKYIELNLLKNELNYECDYYTKIKILSRIKLLETELLSQSQNSDD